MFISVEFACDTVSFQWQCHLLLSVYVCSKMTAFLSVRYTCIACQ